VLKSLPSPFPSQSRQSEEQPKRPRLPKDAHISISQHPREMYVSMTITRMEHIHALNETILTFARMLHGAEED